MRISWSFKSGSNEVGSAFTYTLVADVRDEADAEMIGREFGRLTNSLAIGFNEGIIVSSAPLGGDDAT